MKKILFAITLIAISLSGKAQTMTVINNTCEPVDYWFSLDWRGCDNALVSYYSPASYFTVMPMSFNSYPSPTSIPSYPAPGGPTLPPYTASAWSQFTCLTACPTTTIGDACTGVPSSLKVNFCSGPCTGDHNIVWNKDPLGNVTVTINP